jgi:hypothetical protein
MRIAETAGTSVALEQPLTMMAMVVTALIASDRRRVLD